jgi:hypothetical protein
MSKEFNTETIDITQREVFVIWKNRFVDEYNRSAQHRQGHTLMKGVPLDRWIESFGHECGPHWIRQGVRNIGFVSPQQITIGMNEETAKPIKVVSDVYVDPKFRGKGLLAACLLSFQEQGINAILIDELKLLENAVYYAGLGYQYAMRWPEQELLIVSKEPSVDVNLWFRLIPEKIKYEQTQA